MSCCKPMVIGNIMLIHFVYLLTVITISHQNKKCKKYKSLRIYLAKMAPSTPCIHHMNIQYRKLPVLKLFT